MKGKDRCAKSNLTRQVLWLVANFLVQAQASPSSSHPGLGKLKKKSADRTGKKQCMMLATIGNHQTQPSQS